MMKRILLIAFLISFCGVYGQNYSTALGFRLAPAYGINLKHFFQEEKAMEFILTTKDNGYGITGLYEVHTTALKAERLKGYGGIGGHANIFKINNAEFWDWTRSGDDDDNDGHNNNNNDNDNIWEVGDDSRMAIGMDLILGLEYNFNKIPFVIGVDWKPAINILGDTGANWQQVALNARFVLN